ncbi:MAG TPA: 2-dehydro-3-deoxygalactonokinase [Telluria sp.]|nr:2-dehydro-3-deoxygalactonokinase [Telluria sp.]
MSEFLLGIDWGSTNRRAYLMDHGGRCVRRHADGVGMLSARGRFAAALAELCEQLAVPAGTPVVMSGMVGSAQGWQEVPYLTADVPLDELPRSLAKVAGGGRPLFIVPGYCQRGTNVDVMRGEETQLLGARALGQGDGWVVLPGTHSKWAQLQDGRIARWTTYMTGELFALLAQGGTLSALMAEGQEDGDEDRAAFEAGLALARERAPLTHTLFSIRARVVTGSLPAEQARGFVSGLLIGTEFVANAMDAGGQLAILGSPALTRRYRDAASVFGLDVRHIDPDEAYCAALARFFQAKVNP